MYVSKGNAPLVEGAYRKDTTTRYIAGLAWYQGELYFSSGERDNWLVAKVDFNERIAVVGNRQLLSTPDNPYQPPGDGGWAVDAPITYAQNMATDSRGNLYISELRVVRVIYRNGSISTITGALGLLVSLSLWYHCLIGSGLSSLVPLLGV